MKERLVYIDVLKVFAIILVVFGHSTHISSNYQELDLVQFIYTFHMPLFMMLSGFFFRKSLNNSFTKLLKKKATQLLLPSLTWGVLMFVVTLTFGFGKANLWVYVTENYWFLKSLFICYIVTYTIVKIIKREDIAYLLLFVLPLLFYFEVSSYCLAYMLPCFVFGAMFSKYYTWIFEHKKWVYATAAVILIPLLTIWSPDGKDLSWYFTHQCLLMRFTCVMIGISISTILFLLFSKISRISPMISYIGTHTLAIYILNLLFTKALMQLNILIDNHWIDYSIALVIAVFQFAVFIPFIKFVGKYKYLNLICFGSK